MGLPPRARAFLSKACYYVEDKIYIQKSSALMFAAMPGGFQNQHNTSKRRKVEGALQEALPLFGGEKDDFSVQVLPCVLGEAGILDMDIGDWDELHSWLCQLNLRTEEKVPANPTFPSTHPSARCGGRGGDEGSQSRSQAETLSNVPGLSGPSSNSDQASSISTWVNMEQNYIKKIHEKSARVLVLEAALRQKKRAARTQKTKLRKSQQQVRRLELKLDAAKKTIQAAREQSNLNMRVTRVADKKAIEKGTIFIEGESDNVGFRLKES